MLRRPLFFVVVAAAACFPVRGAIAATGPTTERFLIDTDAQIDSQSPTTNYGTSTTDKVLVNGMDGSLVHSLFAVPQTIWTVPAAEVVSVKIWFYVWFDQTGDRTVRLHPLTRGFVEGTGHGTTSGDGATWITYDGVNSWTMAGGDFAPGVFVDAVKDANWFSWDITGLWNNTDLRSFGAILRMNDESDPGYPNMPRAPFTSSEGAASQRPYVEVTYVPVDLCTTHVVWADADGDGDVDQEDFGLLQVCFGGAGVPYPADPQWCRCFDRSRDGSVDADDLAEFERCASGPGIPANANCAN